MIVIILQRKNNIFLLFTFFVRNIYILFYILFYSIPDSILFYSLPKLGARPRPQASSAPGSTLRRDSSPVWLQVGAKQPFFRGISQEFQGDFTAFNGMIS